MSDPSNSGLPQVVIVGAGFGGLAAARGLKKAPVQVALIDRNNYHLFQPLLYQVATAGLSAGDIAEPARSILKGHRNVEVMMEEVRSIDLSKSRLLLTDREMSFDYLILAPGARYNYFGHSEWEALAPGLKTVEDALKIRRKILTAFEKAELCEDPKLRDALLTFVIVGGGPTGVELAGSIAELSRRALASDFRRIDPASARIRLMEAGPRILPAFAEDLSEKSERALAHLGVEVQTNAFVEKIDEGGVHVGGKFLPAKTILWAAGVTTSPLLKGLGVELDKLGRARVAADLSLPGHPNVFVIGDSAAVTQEGQLLPGLAPVAMQEGRYVARVIEHRVEAQGGAALREISPFRYVDKGQLATVGRAFAVAQFGKTKFAGFFAWLVWLFVHIFFLIGLQNRLLVFIQWAWAYVTYERGARVVIGEEE